MIGYYEGHRLVSASGVGTGFTYRMLDELAERVRPLAIDHSLLSRG